MIVGYIKNKNYLKYYRLIFAMVIISFCSFAKAQMREEISVLETYYENKAKTIINTLVVPTDYNVTVSVEIDRDENKLKAIENVLDSESLPGMPGIGNNDSIQLTNKLHTLKNKVDLLLVLGNNVPLETENTLKKLLKVKLHLDEENGDSIQISRAQFLIEKEKQSEKLPELSWKMWLLFMIIALLLLAGIIFIFSRKQPPTLKETLKTIKEDAEEKDEKPKLDKDNTPTANSKTSKEQVKTDESDFSLDSQSQIFNYKQEIISIVTKKPELVSKSIADYFAQGNKQDVLYSFYSFGWEVSKELFSSMPIQFWGKLGNLLRDQKQIPTERETLTALSNLTKHLMSQFIAATNEDNDNPYRFIFQLSDSERNQLLNGESAENLAAICLFADPSEIEQFLGSFEVSLQVQITLELTKIKSISYEKIKLLATTLKQKLIKIKENPEKTINGSAVVAHMLRRLEPEKELSIFDRMRIENPNDADKIRRLTLQYVDIPFIPTVIVEDVLNQLELQSLVTALGVNHYPNVKEFILKCLPVKKARMIEKDLNLPNLEINHSESARSKRYIVLTLESELQKRNLSVSKLIPEKHKNENSSKAG